MSALERAGEWYLERSRAAADAEVTGNAVGVTWDSFSLLLSGLDVPADELKKMLDAIGHQGFDAWHRGEPASAVFMGVCMAGFLIGHRTRVEQELEP